MYLRDYLHDIPLKALKAIADALGITVEYRARIKLVNAIDRAFWDGTLTKHLIEGLSNDHRRVLSLLAFSYTASVREQALQRKMEKTAGIPRKRVRKLVHDLIPLALVGGIHDDDNLYFCPTGIDEQIRKLLIGDVFTVPDSSKPTTLFSPSNLLEDIFSFLAQVNKENLPLTLTGRVKKKFLERVFDGSPTCDNSALHFPPEHRNAFVIDYLKHRKLVSFEMKQARVTPKLSGWLDLSMTERFQDIVSFALSHKLQDSSTIIALNGMLSEIPVGASFDVQGLTHFLHTHTMAGGGVKRLKSRLRDILIILTQLGLLSFADGRFSLTESGECFFRGKTLPVDSTMGTSFTIQPNFEVIAGPELHPNVRFILELLASRKTRDTVLTYVLTQDGIARARERGMSTDDVIRFFDEHSRTPVPQNVRFSIETWANSYGSIFFEDVTLMRFRDIAICNSIIHSPDISPFIKEQLSDTALVVSSQHIPVINDFLKKAGFLPEVFGETVPVPILSGSEFTFNRISDILEKHTVPEVHHDFILPRDLLTDGDST